MDDLIASVREILSTTPERWLALTAAIDPARLAARPAPGEWSAIECLQHILDTELGAFSVRLEAFRAGRDLAAFDPDSAGFRPEPASDPVGLAARFAQERAQRLAAIERLEPADLGADGQPCRIWPGDAARDAQ